MSLWWLYTILAVLTGISLAAMLAIASDRRNRRAGLLDLTGIRPRAGYDWSAARARAHVPALMPVEVDPALVSDWSASTTLDMESETELARRVATQQQPRGADAA